MHLVASLGTHLLDVEITACRQGAQRSACEHFERPDDEGVAAAGASQEGATPKPGGARDPCGARRNAGVQGGTKSSNLLCSSGESCTNLSFFD
jgi:hypothetical protein